jgi:hypothetical protein
MDSLTIAMQVASVLGWLLLAMIAGGLGLNAFDRYARANYARVLAEEQARATAHSARCRTLVARHKAIMSRRRRRLAHAQPITPDQTADQAADQPADQAQRGPSGPVVTDAGGRVLPPLTLLSDQDHADMAAMRRAGLSKNLIIRRFGGDRTVRLRQLAAIDQELGIVAATPGLNRMAGRQTAAVST